MVRKSGLGQDEDVVLQVRPHPLSLASAAIAPLLAAAAGITVVAAFPSAPIWVLEALGVFFVLVTAPLVGRWFRWRRCWHTITTHRVIAGADRSMTVPPPLMLDRVADISYEQSFWQRVANMGTVRIRVAGTGALALRSVRSPGQFATECWRRAYRRQAAASAGQRDLSVIPGGEIPDAPAERHQEPADPEIPWALARQETTEQVVVEAHPTQRIPRISSARREAP